MTHSQHFLKIDFFHRCHPKRILLVNSQIRSRQKPLILLKVAKLWTLSILQAWAKLAFYGHCQMCATVWIHPVSSLEWSPHSSIQNDEQEFFLRLDRKLPTSLFVYIKLEIRFSAKSSGTYLRYQTTVATQENYQLEFQMQ